MIVLTHKELAVKTDQNLAQHIADKNWTRLSAVFVKNGAQETFHCSHLSRPLDESLDFEITADIDNESIALGFEQDHSWITLSSIRVQKALPGEDEFSYFEINLKTGRILDEEIFGQPKKPHDNHQKLFVTEVGQNMIFNQVCNLIRTTRELEVTKVTASMLSQEIVPAII